MKFYQNEIESYEQKVNLMKHVQTQLDTLGLAPDMPAISISMKKAIMLTSQVEAKFKKLPDGIEKLEIKVAGYAGDRDGGKWYPIEDLAPFTDAARILYLK